MTNENAFAALSNRERLATWLEMNASSVPATAFDLLLLMFGAPAAEVAAGEHPAPLNEPEASFARILQSLDKHGQFKSPVDSLIPEEVPTPEKPANRPEASSDSFQVPFAAPLIVLVPICDLPLPVEAERTGMDPSQPISGPSHSAADPSHSVADPSQPVAGASQPPVAPSVILVKAPQSSKISFDGAPAAQRINLDRPYTPAMFTDKPSLQRETESETAVTPSIDSHSTPHVEAVGHPKKTQLPRLELHREQTEMASVVPLKQAVVLRLPKKLDETAISNLKAQLQHLLVRMTVTATEAGGEEPSAPEAKAAPKTTPVVHRTENFAVEPTHGDALAVLVPAGGTEEVQSTAAPRTESTVLVHDLTSIQSRPHEPQGHTVIDVTVPDLGGVQIELARDDDETIVTLHADAPVHLLIRENLHEFVAALSESGIELAAFDLRQHGDREQPDLASSLYPESPGVEATGRSEAPPSVVRTGLARYRLMSVTA